MRAHGEKMGIGISLFLFGAMSLLAAQEAPSPQAAEAPPAQGAAPAAATVPDHARAYYHFTLARRYRELAGAFNRSEYIERAIAGYKQALEADPDSLFLRTELAELYARVSRTGDAVREAEAVLKINPDYADAHRLLARIYWHALGENLSEAATKESLGKAMEHLEAVVRLDPADVESALELGRLYKVTNQGTKAEELFKRLLDDDPTSRSALANLAQLYFDRGDYDQAVELLQRIPEDAMEPSLLGMLGYGYLQTRQFDKAVAAYEKALALDPDNLDLRRVYAEGLMASGKTAAARAELEKILRLEPQDGAIYLRLAQVDRQEGRFELARQELERARSLIPDNSPASAEVTYQQALLENLVGNDDKAIQLLQGLLKQSERPEGRYTPAEANNRAVFLERLGVIYRTQEKFESALAVFRQILALGSGLAARGESLIIETLRLNRQPRKALELAQAAVEKYPQERRLRVQEATLLGEQGRLEEAVGRLRALLKDNAADQEIYMAMGQIYAQAKRFPEAEAVLLKALDLSATPDDQEFPLFLLGSVFERQKQYDRAEEQFKKVLAVNPLNAAAANYMGYMLADRGVRLEESVQYIQKALELEPNNGAYLDSLGWAYFKMRRFDEAEAYLEKAARLIPSDPTIREHLGRVYLQLGKKRQAQEQWERALKEGPRAVGSEFDAEQAARLRKELEELKQRSGR
jgi:tetratricopeptide (TPR) repeat protein